MKAPSIIHRKAFFFSSLKTAVNRLPVHTEGRQESRPEGLRGAEPSASRPEQAAASDV